MRDVNDVVVSRYQQRLDIKEFVSSRCPPPEKNHQTLGELHDGYQNELARDVSNGKILDSRIYPVIRAQSSKTAFFSIRIV